eukprot:838828-Prorocentrum_minimum.AAC.1
MKGLKLRAYYQTFTKLLADIVWSHDSTEAIRFFVEGLNPDALPSNLKLVVHDCTNYPGVTVMQVFAYAERKLSLAHGENYNNVSLPSNRTTNVGDKPKVRRGRRQRRNVKYYVQYRHPYNKYGVP